MSDVIEAMARAICAERGTDPEWPHNGGPGWWTTYRGDAEEALTALRTARPDVAALLDGEALAVPKEPTTTMLNEGGSTIHLAAPKDPLTTTALHVFKDMLAASPYAQKETPR